ncbi:MAG: hypothetical protein MUF42_06100 [Cytophagaceae bacterium]|nr:hypothetical protein [Cytophagaceae bacterium]
MLLALVLRGQVLLDGNVQEVQVAKGDYQILEDSSGALSFGDLGSRSYQFHEAHQDYEYAKNKNSWYWLRVKVALGNSENRWVMELPNHHTEHIEVFLPKASGPGVDSIVTGAQYSFAQRPYSLANFVFNLPPRDTAYFVYVRIHSSSGAGFEIKFKTIERLASYSTREYWFLGIFYGILFFLFCYQLILFLTNKEKLYLSYAGYLLACALMAFAEDNLFFQFLWPGLPTLNRFIFLRAEYIFLICFFVYGSQFLHLFREKKSVLALLLGSVIGVIVLEESWHESASLWVSLMYCLPFLLIYVQGLRKIGSGNRSLYLFLLGCTFVIASIILVRLRWYGIVPVSIFSVYIFNISVVFETFIFSYAATERFALIKEEKERAQSALIQQLEENKQLQDKVNRELEEKVKDRTLALEKEKEKLAGANAQLSQLTDELNRINSKLDFENWHLQKDLKEEKKSRILLEKVPYEEFISIFPNDHSCFQFLEKCKWEHQYSCLKCKNNRYISKAEKPFVRRCTRCGYIESVTTHTLFHAVKFPLNKAFYLAYNAVYERDEKTLDELSELLQLRRNTCWSFRKKVLERVELYQSQKGIPLRNWENIIVDE